MNHIAIKSYDSEMCLLILFSPQFIATYNISSEECCFLRCLFLHVFFPPHPRHLGLFLILCSSTRVWEVVFGGGRSDSHICQFIDKILATRLLMSYFDELPGAFLNTLLQISFTFAGGVIDPSEI